jgi:hypothetical protein
MFKLFALSKLLNFPKIIEDFGNWKSGGAVRTNERETQESSIAGGCVKLLSKNLLPNAGHSVWNWYHRGCGRGALEFTGHSAVAITLILVQLPYFFILLSARNNGGLFSVPAPPTYASERRGFLLDFRPHFFFPSPGIELK